MRIYDGNNFSYCMPRYYRDRLFSINKTFIHYETSNKLCVSISPILAKLPVHFCFAPPCFTYELKVRKDKRYVRENFLSCAIAYRLQLLALARSSRDERKYKGSLFCRDENGIIHSRFEDDKRASIEARRKVAEASLRNFYTSNMWKNRILDFDADTFSAEDFTNFFYS